MGRIARAVFTVGIVASGSLGCGSTTSSNDPSDAGPQTYCATVIFDTHDPPAKPADGVAACPAGDCNYQSGSGCQTGSACRPQFSAESAGVNPGCEPAGNGVTGSACATSAECAARYFCAEGSCRKQCCGADWSTCDAGESCIRQVDVRAGGQIEDSGLALCYPVNDCDPLETGSCNGSKTRECKIVDPRGAVACEPLGAAHVGESCKPSASCVAGLVCVLDTCRQVCRTEMCGEPGCPEGAGACVHFNRDPDGTGECTPGR